MYNFNNKYMNLHIVKVLSIYRYSNKICIKYLSPELKDDIICLDSEEEAIEMYNDLMQKIK